MDQEKKAAIIELCKEHIENQGSVRVGWAAEQVFGSKQQNHIHDKIANSIIQSGEYIKEPSRRFKFDWNIYRNPNYKKEKWTDKHPLLKDFAVGTITAAFSLAVGLVLWNIQDQASDERYDSLEKRVDVLNSRVNSLQTVVDSAKLK